MRTTLYVQALVALRHNKVVKAFGKRRRKADLAPTAVWRASVHKLAMPTYSVLRSGGTFDAHTPIARLEFQDGIRLRTRWCLCPMQQAVLNL